jgi:hypothetical protein
MSREAELRAWREAKFERVNSKPVTHAAVVTHAVTHSVTHTSNRERVARWRKAHGDDAKAKHREYMRRRRARERAERGL